jgi:hypothetical protein
LATATADKKGMKRICPGCSTRYYDFNKRPVVCPNCKMEFTAEVKAKVRRRAAANDVIEDSQVTEDTAAEKGVVADEDEEDVILEGEEGVVSLEEIEDDDDDDADEDEETLEEEEADLDDAEDFDDEDDDDEEEEAEAEDGDKPAKKPKKK